MRSPSPLRAESPRVGDAQGSVTRSSPLIRTDVAKGPETYSLFKPGDVFSDPRSAKLRRIEAEMANLRLDDIYNALIEPWQIDRKDINDAHGTQWDSNAKANFWISSDSGKVCFAAIPSDEHALAMGGQYHKDVGGSWKHFLASGDAPGNVGGFHGCCVDTLQPGSEWMLVVKLSDFGMALGRDAGLRAEFAALVRTDVEAVIASVGPHDECRSLFCVDQVTLPTGRVALVDPAELAVEGSGAEVADGLVAPTGLGAGYYPVVLSTDSSGKICRITAVFHGSRLPKVCERFPPALPPGKR